MKSEFAHLIRFFLVGMSISAPMFSGRGRSSSPSPAGIAPSQGSIYEGIKFANETTVYNPYVGMLCEAGGKYFQKIGIVGYVKKTGDELTETMVPLYLGAEGRFFFGGKTEFDAVKLNGIIDSGYLLPYLGDLKQIFKGRENYDAAVSILLVERSEVEGTPEIKTKGLIIQLTIDRVKPGSDGSKEDHYYTLLTERDIQRPNPKNVKKDIAAQTITIGEAVWEISPDSAKVNCFRDSVTSIQSLYAENLMKHDYLDPSASKTVQVMTAHTISVTRARSVTPGAARKEGVSPAELSVSPRLLQKTRESLEGLEALAASSASALKISPRLVQALRPSEAATPQQAASSSAAPTALPQVVVTPQQPAQVAGTAQEVPATAAQLPESSPTSTDSFQQL